MLVEMSLGKPHAAWKYFSNHLKLFISIKYLTIFKLFLMQEKYRHFYRYLNFVNN